MKKITKITKITTTFLASTLLLGIGAGLLIENNSNLNHLLIKNNATELQNVGPTTKAIGPTTFIFDQERLPKDVTFIKFNDYLKSNGATLVSGHSQVYQLSAKNLEWLGTLGQLTSVVENSVWWMGVTLTFPIMSFVLSSNIIYNEYGVQNGSSKGEYVDRKLVTEGTMQIAKVGDIPPATEITSKANSPVVSNSDVFLADAKTTDGDWDLNFLSKYIGGLNTIPLSATIQDIAYIGQRPSGMEWELKVSGYYDGTSSAMQGEKTFSFKTQEYPHNETIITTKFGSPIVKNETLFIESVKNTDGSWNLTELSKYVDGLGTLPSGETVTDVVFVKSEGKILSFELTVSGWYDGIDNPIQPPKVFGFEVNTFPIETIITTNPNAPTIESETAFIESIKNADNTWNITELSKYVNGLDTLPPTATILDVIFEKQNDAGTYEFKVKVSGWYNGSDDTIQPEKEYNFTVKNKDVVVPPTNDVSDQFPWWWIIVGIGGPAIIAVGVWFILKNIKQ